MFKDKWIHFIGIGGISMSGIAKILLSLGSKITGSDMQESENVDSLRSKGISVDIGENLDNVKNADIIVYTAAIKEDNNELRLAKELNKPLYERSVFLGLMMKEYENVICISGTHGKSTTSGMISQIFMEASLNPTIQIGANLPIINGNEHVGDKKYFIAEACEYVESFLDFFPTCEIILNIDDDHLDYFGNIDNIIKSFSKYTTLLPEDGYLIINNDDKNTKKMNHNIKNTYTFGINNQADVMAKNITFDENGFAKYDLYFKDKFITNITLSVKGMHNVYNSLAASCTSLIYSVPEDIIANGLNNYHGVQRRFEYLGKYNGANIYDDYAHHPSEIETTVDSVNKTKHNKCYAIFQSHTYSRTKDHLEEFAKVLSKFENIIIAKIYPAREENIYNVHEEDLVNLIKENGNQNVMYIDNFEDIYKYLKDNVKENDLVITCGAGPVVDVAKMLIERK